MSTPPRIELDRAIRLAINQTTPSELAALGSSLGRTQPTSTPKRVLGPRPNVINTPFQINSSKTTLRELRGSSRTASTCCGAAGDMLRAAPAARPSELRGPYGRHSRNSPPIFPIQA